MCNLVADSSTDYDVLLTCFYSAPFWGGGKRYKNQTKGRDFIGKKMREEWKVLAMNSAYSWVIWIYWHSLSWISSGVCPCHDVIARVQLRFPFLLLLGMALCLVCVGSECVGFLLVFVEISWLLLSSCLCFALLLWKDGVQPEFRTSMLCSFQDRYRMGLLDKPLVLSWAERLLTNPKEENDVVSIEALLEMCDSAIPIIQE